MKKLCFASYAKTLVLCKAIGVTQTSLVAQIITSFCGNSAWNIENSAVISDILSGKKNLPLYAPVEARECNPDTVVDIFSSKIIRLLDDSKIGNMILCIKDLIREDARISDKTVVDPISKKTKAEILNTNIDNIPEFLVGVLLYSVKNTDKENSKETLQLLTSEYISSFNGQDEVPTLEDNKIKQKADMLPANEEFSFDESTSEKARLFCIEYEEDLPLLPLCEIAAEVNPEHKHLRPIFTAFIRQNKKTQKAILVRKSLKPFEYNNPNWIDDCVKRFDKDIKEKELTTVNFLYDGAKYFHRAFEYYADYKPTSINPAIFKKKTENILVFPNIPCCLFTVIDEYSYGKEDNSNIRKDPPFDTLWYGLDLANCDEATLTFWVCRFIIDVCHWYYGFDPNKEYDENWEYKDREISGKLVTMEDMYYYALLLLYMSYGGEV